MLLPRRPCHSIHRRSHHTSSSAHLGVPRTRPSIYAYHTRSFALLGISHLLLRIPTSQPTQPPPIGCYYMTFSPTLLFLLASLDITSRAAQSFFSVASWLHQASLLRRPLSYPFYLSHTSNRGYNTTRHATVACRLPM